MTDHKRIEKLAKKQRKKLLRASGKHETAGPMAMQPPREGDDVTDSPPGPAGAYSAPDAGALVTADESPAAPAERSTADLSQVIILDGRGATA